MEEKASLLVQLNQYLESISNFVWGPPLLILLVGTGVYLSIRLLFLQFRALPLALKQTFISHSKHKHDGDVSHFAALMTALSATIRHG